VSAVAAQRNSATGPPAGDTRAADPAHVATGPSAAETATARALFREGVELADGRRWVEAADRFERVLAIRWSSAAAYNLAGALTELGRLVEACEGYRAVIRHDGAPAKMRAEARRALSRLEGRLGSLRVDVTGDPTGVEVHVDGLPLPRAAWGVSVPTNPGPHVIVATRAGRELGHTEVLLGTGGPLHDAVVLHAPPAAPSPGAVAAAYDPTGDADGGAGPQGKPGDDPPITETWWFWTGAGVVATTAVAVLLIALVGASNSGASSGAPAAARAGTGATVGQ
jgi:hypothetical protein